MSLYADLSLSRVLALQTDREEEESFARAQIMNLWMHLSFSMCKLKQCHKSTNECFALWQPIDSFCHTSNVDTSLWRSESRVTFSDMANRRRWLWSYEVCTADESQDQLEQNIWKTVITLLIIALDYELILKLLSYCHKIFRHLSIRYIYVWNSISVSITKYFLDLIPWTPSTPCSNSIQVYIKLDSINHELLHQTAFSQVEIGLFKR